MVEVETGPFMLAVAVMVLMSSSEVEVHVAV